MKLIVGLGNPGKKYFSNRHNIGFRVVDSLAEKHGIPLNGLQGNSSVGRGSFRGEKVLLAKPLTFMNRSGGAVKVIMKDLNISPLEILVVHDDLDLDLGRIRLRPRGGAGGHRGIASIIEKIQGEDFNRMKIGIGRPSGNQEARDYVLEDFTPEEEEQVEKVIEKAVEALETFLAEGMEAAMNKHNC